MCRTKFIKEDFEGNYKLSDLPQLSDKFEYTKIDKKHASNVKCNYFDIKTHYELTAPEKTIRKVIKVYLFQVWICAKLSDQKYHVPFETLIEQLL